jgi:hypothetical protein
MTTSEKAHLLRCAAVFVTATYEQSTPRSSAFSRLAPEAFCEVFWTEKLNINLG